ncbi:MAG TPA: zinc ribbon domain-containing protein [Clostridia bacterium]|jgi:putative FmdB family regulatory protein|nr:zinc ribbon domain-containing protein [Clostridia bacterium]
MALLKFKCKVCAKVFDELTPLAKINEVRCPDCGGETERAYEGKCAGSPKEGCSGSCSCCSGCH